MTDALQALLEATRAYQATLRPPTPTPAAPATPAPTARAAYPLDPEALGRLTAPVVSRLIARDIRERGDLS